MGIEDRVLARIPSTLRRSVKVVTPDTLGRPMLYHISDNKNIRKFEPIVSNRQLGTEDRRIARVSTSSTLMGCIAGHAATEYMFTDMDFDGVFKVYGIAFEAALKPTAKLVADGPQTGEHWLTTFDDASEVYPAVPLADFSYLKIVQHLRGGVLEAEMILKVRSDDGLWVTSNRRLESGHYRLTGEARMVVKPKSRTREPMTVLNIESISPSEYRSELKERGALTIESVGGRHWMTW